MYTWFAFIVSICCSVLIIPSLLFRRRDNMKLPPGPSFLSSNFLFLTNSVMEIAPILRNLKIKYGPLMTLYIGSRPSIFVGSYSLAHQVLIQKGTVFSDRPRTSSPMRKIFTSSYGPTWRVLRRNLASEMLHPSRVKSYSWTRKWALYILMGRLQAQKDDTGGIKVAGHFHHAIFYLSALMCFGEKLDEHRITEMASIHRSVLVLSDPMSINILRFFPRLDDILFRNRRNDFLQMLNVQEKMLIPLIKSRIEATNSQQPTIGENQIVTYVDTLVNLQLPEEEININENGGKLTHKEMVSLCSEFIGASSDTTSTVLLWIMANLVKDPHIQSKLYEEIFAVVGTPPPPDQVELESFINEEDLKKMPYLKAVVLEGLRRHPPGLLTLPHRTTEEVEVEGFTIPQGATINFMVVEMGLDPKVWDDPMEFNPDRFMVNDTRSKGMKMMPFGIGSRMCPGSDLAMLHLEYFVANLIWYFNWTTPDGYHVDLSEKVDFTIGMKNPMQAKISSRTIK